jgi:hypothetical protein
MNKPLSLLLLCLLLAACGGSVGSRLTPAVSDGPYAQDLVACAHVFKRGGNNSHNFCSLNRLPLLGQEHEQLEAAAQMPEQPRALAFRQERRVGTG